MGYFMEMAIENGCGCIDLKISSKRIKINIDDLWTLGSMFAGSLFMMMMVRVGLPELPIFPLENF